MPRALASQTQASRDEKRILPTPNYLDRIIVERLDRKLANYAELPYGTAHPDTTAFPNHKLVLQVDVANSDDLVDRYYAADRSETSQEQYNASIGYSGELNAYPVVTRDYLLPRTGYTPDAKGTADPLFAGTILTKEDSLADPGDERLKSLYVAVRRVYEILPGPWLPFTRYDDNLGPVQGRRRSVLNTGQAPSLTPTSKTTYEARENSAYVSLEIQETWSDGTGVPGPGGEPNPPFPIKPESRIDVDGVSVAITRQLVTTGAIVTGETLAAGVWTRKFTATFDSSPFHVFQVIETRPIPGNVLEESEVDAQNSVINRTRQMVEATTVTEDSTESTGVITKEFGEIFPNSDLVAWQVVEAVIVFDRSGFEKSVPDVVPQEFRALLEQESTTEIVPGTAAAPTLGTGDISRSEAQLTTLTKEVTQTRRDPASVPATLGESRVNEVGQVVAIAKTIDNGLQTITPTATVSGEVVNLGNGQSVKRTDTLPGVFGQARHQATRPDVVPEAFRVVIPTTTTSTVTAGTAAAPTLGTGELSKVSEQLTVFTKRDTVESRGAITYPVVLDGGKIVTPEGQVGTVTQTLDDNDQTITPTATLISGRVDDLGDGSTLKEEVVVGSVFGQNTYSADVSDPIPERFRALIPATDTSVVSAGTAAAPSLGAGDLRKTEEQITVQKKRVSTRTRAGVTLPVSLAGKDTNDARQVVTVTETLQEEATTPATPSATQRVSVENLGDGNVIQRVEAVPSVFSGIRYEKSVPDVVPQAFRVAIPTSTTATTASGTAADPTLGTGELARSSTQIDAFTKREEITSRGAVAYPVVLGNAKVLTPEGQVGTITQTLDDSAQTITPSATLVDANVQDLGDGTTLKSETSVSSVFGAQTYEAERPNLTPQVFQGLIPTTTESSVVAGTAAAPTLGTGDLSASEEQITAQKKRLRRATQSAASLPATIVDTQLTPQGQLATVTRTLDSDPQTITPSATVIDGNIEHLGDGTSVKTESTVASVFDPAVYRKELPDSTPPEFRALLETSTERHTTAGTAATPTLGTGELIRTETQQTAFIKTVEVTSRDTASLPVSLSDTFVDDDGIVVTRARTLDDTVQTITPSATVFGRVENLGDGTTAKTQNTRASVFGQQLHAAERPDATPQKFRVAIPAVTTGTTSAGTAAAPTLGTGDLSATSRQVTAFTKRDEVVSRAGVTLPVSLVGKDTDREGQVVTVTETLQSSATTPAAPSATQTVTVETIGDGNVVQTVRAIPGVFAGTEYSKTVPDPVPQEFRLAAPALTTAITSAGTAAEPTLATGEFSRASRQIDVFTKRDEVTSRAGITFPVGITDTFVDNDGVIVTRVRTLDDSVQTITPTATVFGEVNALGDGSSVKTQNTRASVFGRAEYSIDVQDPTPLKFRVAAPATTAATTSAGTAAAPTLGTGELAKSSLQVDAFTKRDSVTSRAGLTLPISLVGKDTNQLKQIVTVTETLQDDGAAVSVPSATQDVTVETIGDGNVIQTVRSIPSVFSAARFEKQVPDVVPSEFRVAIPTSTTSTISAGTAADPTLGTGELARASQQLDAFTKREEVTSRGSVTYPVVLSGAKILTAQGQVGTVTQTLDDSLQTITPSATTIDANVRDLGDGTTLKSETTVASVFDAATYAKSIPDATPAEFRALLQTTVEQHTVAGTAAAPTLGVGELSRRETQQTAFVKETEVVSRNTASLPVSLSDTFVDENRIVVTRVRTLDDTIQTITPTATVSGRVENLGDGTTAKTQETKASIFSRARYSIDVQDPTPLKFRVAAPATTTATNTAGTAAAPTLGTGELSKSSEQVDAFTKRDEVTSRAGITLPVSLVGKDTNAARQVVTVTETLQDDGDAVAAPSATQTVTVETIGDGNVVQRVESVASVFAGTQYSIEATDPTPAKFRIAAPATTTTAASAGTAAAPTLGTGDLAKSSTQIDAFTKRDSTTTRAGLTLPISLVGKDTNNQKQVVTVTETLQDDGAAVATPSATQDVTVETLGDGNVIQTVRSVPAVFSAQQFATEKPELVPLKFRGAIPSQSTRVDESGTAAMPTLATGDIAASQEQVDAFIRRVSTTSRSTTSLPVTLSGQQYLPSGLVATVAEVLDDTVQTITGSATLVQGEVENLGDGLTLKRTVTAPSVFSENVFRVSKPDNVPLEFRAEIPATTTATTISGTAAAPTLGATDLEASEQQINAFVKRTEVTSRAGATYPATLTDTRVNEVGQTVTVARVLDDAAQTITPSATVSGSVRNLGGGLTLKEQETLPAVFGRNVFEKSIPDPIPPEFRMLAPTSTTSVVAAGTAAAPTLATGDISRRETQVTAFVKQTDISTRSGVTVPVTLSETSSNQLGQLVTVAKTLDDGLQTFTPSATVSGQVTNLGNGQSVLRTETLPGVFDPAVFSAQVPDAAPPEFRVLAPTLTERHVASGTAVAPTLGIGELSRTERQETAFTKSTEVVSRDTGSLPASLTETFVDDNKQVVSRVKTLDTGLQTITPSATVSGEVRNLGDGTSVKVQDTVAVFSQNEFAKSAPDPTPLKFRVAAPASETSATSAGTAAAPTLVAGDLEKRERQVDAFTKRTTTITRAGITLPVSLVGKDTDQDGQVVTVTETLQTTATIPATPSATQRVTVETIGDGNVVQTVRAIPGVFSATAYRKEVPDPVPVAFRLAAPALTTATTAAGTAAEPTLATGDLSKSSTQIDAFTKRDETTSRASITFPVAITDTFVDNDGIVNTRVRTLDDSIQTITPSATVFGNVEAIGDGSSVKTQNTRASVFAGTQYSIDVQDPTPLKFRIAAPATTTAATSSGTAAAPTLGTGELSKSSTQLDAFTKRDSTTSRAGITLPVSLVGKDTNQVKQIVTVTETLQDDGDAVAVPSSTQDVVVETLGDGNVIQTVRSIPSVFSGIRYEKSIPDVVPQAFRVAIPTSTTSATGAGTVAVPTLGTGELARSSTQLDAFTKREEVTSRGAIAYPVVLGNAKVLTPEGQVGTITQTLDDSAQTITGSATLIEANVQDLGDGTTLKTETTVPSVFDAATFRRERPDTTPPEFRALLETATERHTVSGTAADPTLGTGELSRTERQQTAFVKETEVTARDTASLPATLSDTFVDQDGVVVTRARTLDDTLQTITPSATVSGRVDNLGDGTSAKTQETKAEVFSANVFAKEAPDPTPIKFRVAVPAETTSSITAGTAASPTLGTGDLAKREEQITKFAKRSTTTSRAGVTLPVSLVGKDTSQVKQVVTVTETLQAAATTPATPSATQDVTVETIGDGNVVQTVRSVPSVFAATEYAKEAPDPVPARFRVAAPALTTATTSAGTAAAPTLGTGDISASSRQLDAFTKRDSVTTRAGVTVPVTLSSTKSNALGQLITVEETLDDGLQTFGPSEVITGEVTNLGNGQSVLRTETLGSVFQDTEYTARRTDQVPPEFDVLMPITSSGQVYVGGASPPTLGSFDISATVRQVTEYTARSEYVSRDFAGLPATVAETFVNDRKQVVARERTIDADTQTITPSATVSGAIRNLGNGYSLRTQDTVAVFSENEFAKSAPDPTPLKFRVAAPATETSTTAAGTAALPTLVAGDLEKRERQLDTFTKRTTTVTRAGVTLPVSLVGKDTDQDGQVVTVTETLQSSATTPATPSATQTVAVETIGDGNVVQTVRAKPGVFAANDFSVTVPDPVPLAFRLAAPAVTTGATSAGTAAAPTLGTGEFAKSSRQLDAFTKRDEVTSRAGITFPVSITDTFVDDNAIVITRVRTLDDSVQTISPSATVFGNVESIGDGSSVKTQNTRASVFGAAQYSIEAPDPTPLKFRVAAPATTTTTTSAGTAAAPTLGTGELSKSSTQLDAFTKRDSTTTRAGLTLPISLVGKDTDRDKQVVTVTETLQSDATTPATPSATQSVTVETVGDGNVIQTVRAIPGVFAGAQYQKSVPDVVPAEFRVAVPTTVTATTSTGTAAMPTLGTGELERTSTQVDAFLKRDEVTSRGSITYPVSLTGSVLTRDGQVGTITQTLDDSVQTFTPSATLVDANVRDLGDGTTLKSETTVASVFGENVFAKTVPDILPERFRVAIPAVETSAVSSGTAAAPTMSAGDLQKSEEQVTAQKKRVRSLTRAGASATTLTGKRILEGLLVTETERYDPAGGQTIDTEASDILTVDARIEPLGDGSDIKTVGAVTSYPTKQGQRYDESLDIVIPYTEDTLENGDGMGDAKTEVIPLDYTRVNVRTFEAPTAALDAYVATFPGTANIRFPDVLTGIEVVWSEASGDGGFAETGSGGSSGTDAHLSLSLRGSGQGSASAMPEIIPHTETIFGSDLPIIDYFFFLPNPVTKAAILSKLNALTGDAVLDWPVFKPRELTFVLTGQKVSVGANSVAQCNTSLNASSASLATSSGGGTDVDYGSTIRAVTIQPTIHGSFSLSGDTSKTVSATASSSANTGSGINYPGASHSDTSTKSAVGSVTPISVAATNFSELPTYGLYMHNCDVDLYRYGYSSVRARVFDFSVL